MKIVFIIIVVLYQTNLRTLDMPAHTMQRKGFLIKFLKRCVYLRKQGKQVLYDDDWYDKINQ